MECIIMRITSNQFESFESRHSLFEFHLDGIPIWERVRHQVFREIKRQNGAGEAHSGINQTPRNYIKRAWLYLKSIVNKNPFFSREREYLFIGHPRRKKRRDGNWWDIYCDPIHRRSNFDYIHLEPHHLLEHRQPSLTKNIRYLDIMNFGNSIQMLLNINDVTIPRHIRQNLCEAKKTIDEQFDAKVDLIDIVQRNLHIRRAQLWMYDQLLNKIDPKTVVLVVSYGKETLIEACKNKEIPVVELQHGVIHDAHFGYSYQGDRIKKMFPDYLLTWGDFWTNSVEFPIPNNHIVSVGYPYLEQAAQQYEDTQSKDQLLFISQGTIGERLSKFALKVEQSPEINYDVVYKLHPGEYDRWRKKYPWLVNADFEVIDSSKPGLYRLFAESSAQIGVGSTAVYEGLLFDLETYVYDCPGSEVLQPLVAENSAEIVSSKKELARKLGAGLGKFDRNRYFAPNATERICTFLDNLCDSEMGPEI